MSGRWVLAVFLIPIAVLAGERQSSDAVILRSTVTGNLEQPKVLYILPWQNPEKITLEYLPMKVIAKEVFSVINREEFQREVSFRRMAAKQKIISQKHLK